MEDAAFVSDRVGLASDIGKHGWGLAFEDARITDTAAELESAIDYCERDTEEARRRRRVYSRDVFSLERFSARLHEITTRAVSRAAA